MLFAIIPLSLEALLFLGTTIRLNFETTITGDSLNPKFHITSLIPTITDRSISLPNIKQVTISQIGPGDNYYKLKFELEGIDPQPPSVPTDKKTYEEVEKLLEAELPEIGKRIPEIICGPLYKGVWAIEMGKKVLHISCECQECHSRRVRRKLNHEVIVLLESNGFTLM